MTQSFRDKLREQFDIYWQATSGGAGDSTNSADIAKGRMAELLLSEVTVANARADAANRRQEATDKALVAKSAELATALKARCYENALQIVTAFAAIVGAAGLS